MGDYPYLDFEMDSWTTANHLVKIVVPSMIGYAELEEITFYGWFLQCCALNFSTHASV